MYILDVNWCGATVPLTRSMRLGVLKIGYAVLAICKSVCNGRLGLSLNHSRYSVSSQSACKQLVARSIHYIQLNTVNATLLPLLSFGQEIGLTSHHTGHSLYSVQSCSVRWETIMSSVMRSYLNKLSH